MSEEELQPGLLTPRIEQMCEAQALTTNGVDYSTSLVGSRSGLFLNKEVVGIVGHSVIPYFRTSADKRTARARLDISAFLVTTSSHRPNIQLITGLPLFGSDWSTNMRRARQSVPMIMKDFVHRPKQKQIRRVHIHTIHGVKRQEAEP